MKLAVVIPIYNEAETLPELCRRRREPDDSVGYSILIYQLSARELNAALNEPPSAW